MESGHICEDDLGSESSTSRSVAKYHGIVCIMYHRAGPYPTAADYHNMILRSMMDGTDFAASVVLDGDAPNCGVVGRSIHKSFVHMSPWEGAQAGDSSGLLVEREDDGPSAPVSNLPIRPAPINGENANGYVNGQGINGSSNEANRNDPHSGSSCLVS